MMFAIITPALITGTFINRVTFKSYVFFHIFWQIFVYYPFVHMIWGGGISLLLKEATAVGIAVAWASIFTFGMLVIINKFVTVKVSHTEEFKGLDISTHGETAHCR